MVRAWCRHSVAALAAGAVLGLWAASPLLAQGGAGMEALPHPLSTLAPAALPEGGGVFRAQLPGVGVYLVQDGRAAAPACVLLHAPGKPDGAAELAPRFQSAYKLTGYETPVAEGNLVLLLRAEDTPPWRYKGQQALLALADTASLAPAIRWLTDVFGKAPEMVEERLVWRKKLGSPKRELEASLSLLQGVPCQVELRLAGVNSGKVGEVLSEQLQLKLEALPREQEKVQQLRRRFGGIKPHAMMSGDVMVGSERRHATLCLVKIGKEPGIYRLAEGDSLRRRRDGRAAEHPLPPVTEAVWADELPAPPPAPVEPTEAPPAPPAPEAARRAYIERLRSM